MALVFTGSLGEFHKELSHIQKDDKDYQDRMDFISALAWCPLIDIDSVARYREEFIKANPNFKKEIETIISSALKNREKSEKDKK